MAKKDEPPKFELTKDHSYTVEGGWVDKIGAAVGNSFIYRVKEYRAYIERLYNREDFQCKDGIFPNYETYKRANDHEFEKLVDNISRMQNHWCGPMLESWINMMIFEMKSFIGYHVGEHQRLLLADDPKGWKIVDKKVADEITQFLSEIPHYG